MSFAETAETALIFPLTPEPAQIARYRDRYDRAAAMGVPLHVTALIPFLPEARVTDGTRNLLQSLVENQPPIMSMFHSVGRFPGSIHYAPNEPDTILDLIAKICATFPETPPYGGAYDDMHVHATVASTADAPIEPLTDMLPLHLSIDRLVLMVRRGEMWRAATTWPFGGPE
ncbi:MAG: 2'-5' RNA ligase family protein [Pseudomonadota bacterium]